jgi:hypothetical protein
VLRLAWCHSLRAGHVGEGRRANRRARGPATSWTGSATLNVDAKVPAVRRIGPDGAGSMRPFWCAQQLRKPF